LNSLQDFVEYLNEDQLIILRSTVYPGVTSKIENFLGEKGIGSRVVFAPERIAEGAAVEELTKLPQLIGARSDEDFQLASNLFAKLGVKSIHISPEEAELAKLLTNVWRYIKFAAANEFYTLCSQNGLSYEKIRQAMVLDYPRASDLPKAGFSAGPCLVKDTATLKTFSGNKLPLGSAALEVNEGLAHFFVNKLRKIHNLEKETIGILGMSFKPEIDDIRSSLTFKLNKALSFHSKKVYMTDPYVVDKRNLNLEWVIENSSILIVATQHKVYENLKTDKPIYIVGKE
jgi:UDP-N-acetyl-D-mannosaminuronic acid dehydrogenase